MTELETSGDCAIRNLCVGKYRIGYEYYRRPKNLQKNPDILRQIYELNEKFENF